jgi:hypothetical protein
MENERSMKTPDGNVAEHYTVTELGKRILSALQMAGKDVEALKIDDLAPVDEFHIRGRTAKSWRGGRTSGPITCCSTSVVAWVGPAGTWQPRPVARSWGWT